MQCMFSRDFADVCSSDPRGPFILDPSLNIILGGFTIEMRYYIDDGTGGAGFTEEIGTIPSIFHQRIHFTIAQVQYIVQTKMDGASVLLR